MAKLSGREVCYNWVSARLAEIYVGGLKGAFKDFESRQDKPGVGLPDFRESLQNKVVFLRGWGNVMVWLSRYPCVWYG